MIDEYNKTHGVLTEPSLQEREQGIGNRELPPVPPFSKEMKSKNDPLGMSALLSVMPDPIGHPSLAEFLDEFLRLRILLVIHTHHFLNRVDNPRA